MHTTTLPKSDEYARAIARLVAKMSSERAAEVYDFALFLSDQPLPTPLSGGEEDWLSDSEEQMQTEDAQWEALYARRREKLNVLADAARDEIAAGTAQPMFDKEGKVNL